MTTTDHTTAPLQAACGNCGVFAIEERDLFGEDNAVFCPSCTDRAELLSPVAGE